MKLPEMMTAPLLFCALGILMSGAFALPSEDLLELKCLDTLQCQQFQNATINATCSAGQCECSSASDGEPLDCTPVEHKVTNIIGGTCPCKQPHSECDAAQNICFCKRHYTPSLDRRRCIPKYAMLGEECELDSQCWNEDRFAMCKSQCVCKPDYVEYRGQCASLVGGKGATCSNDAACQAYGPNSLCQMDAKHCICADTFVAALDSTKCLPQAQFNESCTVRDQCKGNLGEGGDCEGGVCHCDGTHVEHEIESKNNTIIFCEPVVQIGNDCRDAVDCYQYQFDDDHQTMTCLFGECTCRWGFNSLNDGTCVKGNLAPLTRHSWTLVIAAIIISAVATIA